KDLTRNVLTAVQGKQHDLLYTDWLVAKDIFWIANESPAFPLTCKAKIRYRQADQQCRVDFVDGAYRVTFDEPQRAITPGQSVVFYLDELCLGGGVIETTGKAEK
ncbi:MAG: aminomethyltransferase beta-barrel domain-containing protein, partial [Pontibacterium sp.]